MPLSLFHCVFVRGMLNPWHLSRTAVVEQTIPSHHLIPLSRLFLSLW